MTVKHHVVDGRSRTTTILALGLPVIGGMISQNLLNLVDTAFVGTLGNAALAAVGVGGFVFFVTTAFITGLSAGVQAMAARRHGEGRVTDTAVPLNGGLLLAIALALPLTSIAWLAAPALFRLLNPDPEVVALGVPFLRVRLLGAVFVGCNFAYRGYWNGINRPGNYLQTLVIMHAVNIVLCWLLVFGNLGAPRLGTLGAGIATSAATGVGTLYYTTQAIRLARPWGFLREVPDPTALRTMLRISIPAGLQQLLYAAGLTTLFAILGRVGTAEAAAASVLTNVMLVAILPGIALGIVAASLVGQALGRKDREDAYRWGWDVVKVAMVAMSSLGLPMLLFPEQVLSIFIHDPATLALARPSLMVFGAAIAADAVGMILMNALLGAGASQAVMLVSVGMQWLVFLPAAWLIGPMLGYGLLGIWIAQSCYRAIQALIFAVLWRRRAWAALEV
ncbi:MATE family efflux transporter [Chondromyces apiculatus]|uniref:Multidrug-efflux transporter n=1 Tax=Chondromyces apiculatus DSM 436 TaxID=1192034 RepID=A0A017TCG3_9BACT|nr:MATE family efflux transporter [Chondromyces apiculatus]EYF06973.1 Hypothetical protein CAP_1232 [Chondromyces apiculatus DSM 436]